MESKNGGLYDSGIDAPDADRALRPCRKDHEPAPGLSGNLAGLRKRPQDASERPFLAARRAPMSALTAIAVKSTLREEPGHFEPW